MALQTGAAEAAVAGSKGLFGAVPQHNSQPRHIDTRLGSYGGLQLDDDSANDEWADSRAGYGADGVPPLWRRTESLLACWVLLALVVAVASSVYAGGAWTYGRMPLCQLKDALLLFHVHKWPCSLLCLSTPGYPSAPAVISAAHQHGLRLTLLE